MATLPPSRLKDVSNAANFADLTADNFAILAEETAKRTPTYQGGAPNNVIGPPVSGARVEFELWRDSLGAEFRCTVAGTPGTWRQTKPASVTSNPGGAPTGYWIVRSDENFLNYTFDGVDWIASGAEGPAGPPGSVWYDTTGAPAGGLGVVGDWALDNLTSDVYEKTGESAWTFRVNIKGETGGFIGTVLYFDDSPSDIGGYNSMLVVPDVVASEEIDTVVVNSGTSPLLIDDYVTEVGVPNETLIQSGVWSFHIYADADSNTGTSTILIRLYKRTTGGTETLLFETTSPELTTTTGENHEWSVVGPDIVLNQTDRIVVKVYGQTTSGANRTLRFYHNGTTRYSHFHTPIVSVGPVGPQGPQGDPGPEGPAGGTIGLTCDRTTTKAGATGAGVPAGGTAKQKLRKINATDYNTEWCDDVELVTSGRTYYVATTGNDSNDGLTVGAPFLTIQKAVDVAASLVLAAGQDITIQVADGTYTLNARVVLPSTQGVGNNIYIQGNVATPANVVFQSGAAVGQLFAIFTPNSSWWFFRGMTFVSTHNASHLRAAYGGRIQFSDCVFGAAGTGAHLYANFGGFIVSAGNYAISGAAASHYLAESQGIIGDNNRTVTITGTPAFATSFATATVSGNITSAGMTYSGSATGSRYNGTGNGVISTSGGGANYFPGNSAGTVATGAQYI